MKSLKKLHWPVAPEWMAQSAVLPLRGFVLSIGWVTPWPTLKRTPMSQSQVWLIAEKEIATNVLNFKIPAAFSLLLALVLTSFFLMSADYRKRLENWSINRAAQSDKLFSGITSNYRSADNQMSMRAASVQPEPVIRKPFLLSIFAKGLDSVMERSVQIGENPVIPPGVSITFGKMQERNRNLLLFAPPDFLYIAKIFLSLLALFFTFDALVGEREMGTLKAMLAAPLGRRTVLIGKWIGASLSLTVPFVVASFAGIVSLILTRHLSFEPVEWARVLLVLGACVLYGFVFVGLGLLISASVPGRKTAISVALSVWLVLVLVLPNIAVLAADSARPLPNLREHNTRLLAQARAIEDETEKTAKQGESYNSPGYGTMHDSVAPKIRQVVKQGDDAYFGEKLDRDRLVRILARTSPVSSFTYTVTGLAGVGVSEYQSYIEKLQRVRDRKIQLADEKQATISISISTPEEREAASKKMEEFFNRSKQLELELRGSLLQPRSPVQAIRDALPDLVLLISWGGLLIIGAALIFDCADVR